MRLADWQDYRVELKYDSAGSRIRKESLNRTTGLTNPYCFANYWWDDDDLQQYFGNARWYDPNLQRFTGRNSVHGKFQEPLTLHVYLYCMNDPVNRVDPTGEHPIIGPIKQIVNKSVKYFRWCCN